jgi:hypothetical protein
MSKGWYRKRLEDGRGEEKRRRGEQRGEKSTGQKRVEGRGEER